LAPSGHRSTPKERFMVTAEVSTYTGLSLAVAQGCACRVLSAESAHCCATAVGVATLSALMIKSPIHVQGNTYHTLATNLLGYPPPGTFSFSSAHIYHIGFIHTALERPLPPLVPRRAENPAVAYHQSKISPQHKLFLRLRVETFIRQQRARQTI
jgi:hypothetical protein